MSSTRPRWPLLKVKVFQRYTSYFVCGFTFQCLPLDRIIICRVKSGQTTIQLRQRALVDSVRHRLGLGHTSTGLLDSAILFLQVPQWPSCAIWKRFSSDHCCPGRSQAGCRIVGSATKWDWPLEPKSSSPFKNVWCQLVLCIATAGCVDFLEGEPA